MRNQAYCTWHLSSDLSSPVQISHQPSGHQPSGNQEQSATLEQTHENVQEGLFNFGENGHYLELGSPEGGLRNRVSQKIYLLFFQWSIFYFTQQTLQLFALRTISTKNIFLNRPQKNGDRISVPRKYTTFQKITIGKPILGLFWRIYARFSHFFRFFPPFFSYFFQYFLISF